MIDYGKVNTNRATLWVIVGVFISVVLATIGFGNLDNPNAYTAPVHSEPAVSASTFILAIEVIGALATFLVFLLIGYWIIRHAVRVGTLGALRQYNAEVQARKAKSV